MKKNKKSVISSDECRKRQQKQNEVSSDDTKFISVRKKQLLQANEEEDRTIKRLEKLLKLNKRKKGKDSKKKITSGFIDDGLDYLLEVIDRKDGEMILSDDSVDLEKGMAANEEQNTFMKSKRKLKESANEMHQSKRKRTLTDLLKKTEGCVSESENNSLPADKNSLGQDEEPQYFDVSDGNSAESENNKNSTDNDDKKEKPKIWEDIYGRFRDEKGNVIKDSKMLNKYVPPSLRKTFQNDHKQEELVKIKRNLKGLLNRLSESNMQPISHQVEEIYMKCSRNDVNETLFSLMCDLVLTPILTAPRLILEQAMLVTLLHANVGPEVGAFFLQHLVEKLDSLFSFENYGQGKICNNVLTFLSHLYNFKVTHATLFFDIFHKLIDSFQSKDIELIQLLLKNIGFVLRKDDPLKLKEIIQSVQLKVPTVKKDENNSRVNFMIEILTAVRNNNMYKIPGYDPSIIEHSKKLLKGFIRKGCSVQELAISYEDLLKAKERGRWWIVGSAWSERESSSTNLKDPNSSTLPKLEFSEKILQLAQKQHMNTDVRKSVFCIIMTAEDYIDAFQKLLKLNLKHQQEREIINVILHCVMIEKDYNPYYSYLAEKFCNFARKYQISLQYSSWDKFKMMAKMKPYKIKNFAEFLSHCFIRGALPLSVLKVIHYSEMDKTMVKFFRIILLAILLHDSEEICIKVFKQVSVRKNLKLFRETVRHFMCNFLLKNPKKYTEEVAVKLMGRIELADRALMSAKNSFQL